MTDGLASGLLAGVSPIFGLYACMAGPIAGGIFSSTQLLIIATTSAAALGAGQALGGIASPDREGTLFVMAVAIGIFQLVFGLLCLGRLARFVSYSVMTGFLTGIAVLTVLSQLPTVTGYDATGSNRVAATLDLLQHLDQVDPATVAVSAFTLVLALVLPRTRLGNFGNLVAIILPSLAVILLSLGSVQIVRDVGEIPPGLPTPVMPSLSYLSLDVLTGALAIAVIILVQGAGVSQSVPNPDGSRSSVSRDFVAQGAANIASGLFRGIPVGGSLSTTALSVLSGASTRWAAIFAGAWMAIVVVFLPNVVARIAMPPLGMLLIVASANAIKPEEAVAIWNTGWPSRLAIVTTFVATLFLPIQVAVGIGVVLAALLNLFRAATDVSLVELVRRSDGRIEERKPPKLLNSNSVTVLDVYGHLFYAGARSLERLLPKPDGGTDLIVILRLRGRTRFGATLIDELATYADVLELANGQLYLTGISEEVATQMERNGKLHEIDPVSVYMATPIVGESTRQAVADARMWLVSRSDGRPAEESPVDGVHDPHGKLE